LTSLGKVPLLQGHEGSIPSGSTIKDRVEFSPEASHSTGRRFTPEGLSLCQVFIK